MDSTIIVAIIGATATIIAAVIGTLASRSKDKVNVRLEKELDTYRKTTDMLSPSDYGIKILDPHEYKRVERGFDVSGSYERLPDGQKIYLATFEVNKEGDISKYWSQGVAKTSNGYWEGRVRDIGTAKSGDTKEFLVLVAGKDGQILFQYFGKVGDTTGKWLSLSKVTSDTVKCVTGKVIAASDFTD